MKGKLIAILIILIMLVMQLQTPLTISGAESNEQITEMDIKKDETVYINLDSSGKLVEVNVVNRIQTPNSGIYIDYGSYEKISGLSKASKYEVTGDKIMWELEQDSKGFYYQGRLKDAKVPFIFQVKYSIDGVETPAEDMSGKKGKVRIYVEAIPNMEADERFRGKYFYQIQAELNLDRCTNISAPEATSIISGRTQNLGFMLMPDEKDSFEISFETDDFAFDGFTMTSMVFDIESMVDIDTDEIKDGFEQLSHASGKLIDGTSQLKSGMDGLSKGVKKLSNGAKDTKSGLNKFKDGLTEYSGGISELTKNAKQIEEELLKLSQGGQALSAGFVQVKDGIGAMLSQIDISMLPPAFAQGLEQLSQGISGILTQYEGELNKFTMGVSALSEGMTEFYKGLVLLDDSGKELLPGLTSIINGMGKLTDGLSQTASQIQTLPGKVNKLVDGQTQLKDGLKEAAETVDDFNIGVESDDKVISFVSDKNSPESVQFIYKTAEIGTKEDETPQVICQEEKKGFFQRFLDLFR